MKNINESQSINKQCKSLVNVFDLMKQREQSNQPDYDKLKAHHELTEEKLFAAMQKSGNTRKKSIPILEKVYSSA